MASLLNMSGGSLFGKGLPYDAEIEYLESTGTQYIDTLYAVSTDNEIHAVFASANIPLEYDAFEFFGQGNSYNNMNIEYFYSNASKHSVCCNGYSYAGTFVPGNKYDIHFKNKYYTIRNEDGTVNCTVDFSNKQDFTAPHTMTIFALYRSIIIITKKPVRCYLFQILDDEDNYILNLIPVRKDGIGYMYDKVSGQLFGNAGTGSFILGPDK